MQYVYVKDEEGFVCKKQKKDVQKTETIISQKEYSLLSGEDYYKKTFLASTPSHIAESQHFFPKTDLKEKSLPSYKKHKGLSFSIQ